MARLKRYKATDTTQPLWAVEKRDSGDPPILPAEVGLVEIVDCDNDATLESLKPQAQLDAEVTAALAALKAIADSTVDAIDQQGLLTRALAVVILDAVNTIHSTWTDFKTETAAATSLANFQSRVAANTPDLPQRTKAQLLAAIKNEIAAD